MVLTSVSQIHYYNSATAVHCGLSLKNPHTTCNFFHRVCRPLELGSHLVRHQYQRQVYDQQAFTRPDLYPPSDSWETA